MKNLSDSVQEYDWELDHEVTVELREPLIPLEGVIWWYINYRYLKMSIYFDLESQMGAMDQPYYEIMINPEPDRHFDTPSGMKEMLDSVQKKCRDHNEDIITNPELFL